MINQYLELYFRRDEPVNVNEQKQKEALKEFYENEILKKNNEDQIKRLKKFSRVINPLFCIGFVMMFWAAGMHHYYQKLWLQNLAEERYARKIEKGAAKLLRAKKSQIILSSITLSYSFVAHCQCHWGDSHALKAPPDFLRSESLNNHLYQSLQKFDHFSKQQIIIRTIRTNHKIMILINCIKTTNEKNYESPLILSKAYVICVAL